MALGAQTGDIGRLLISHIGKIAVVGGGIGLAMAPVLGRLGETLLFGVTGTDPAISAGAVAAMGTVILAAAVVPTRRAPRVDPVVALRAE